MRLPSTARIVQFLVVFIAQVALVVVTTFCIVGVIIQIVDEGGGASGREARRRITVERRARIGFVWGSVGFLSAVAAVGLNRVRSPSPSLKKTVMDEL
jgi:hypothetical protein